MPDHDVCEDCSRFIPSWQMVLLGGEVPANLCSPCFNAMAADRMGLAWFEEPQVEPETFEDSAGEEHTFHYLGRLVATGYFVDAVEVVRGEPEGYRLGAIGPLVGSPYLVLAELRQRIRAMLAYRSLERHGGEPALPDGRPVYARIDYDSEGEEPAVVIDGQTFGWAELGRMLLTYEGWQLRLEIRDKTEAWRPYARELPIRALYAGRA